MKQQTTYINKSQNSIPFEWLFLLLFGIVIESLQYCRMLKVIYHIKPMQCIYWRCNTYLYLFKCLLWFCINNALPTSLLFLKLQAPISTYSKEALEKGLWYRIYSEIQIHLSNYFVAMLSPNFKVLNYDVSNGI